MDRKNSEDEDEDAGSIESSDDEMERFPDLDPII